MRLVSRSMIVCVAIVVAAASLAAGCADSAAEPTVNRFGPGRFDSLYVSYEGEKYISHWGPLREDLANLSVLSPLDSPVMTYTSPGAGQRTVIIPEAFEIEGVADREFIVGRLSPENSSLDTSKSTSTPSCVRRNRVFIFTAVDAETQPPPFSYPTRTPSDDGKATPTPALTSTVSASVPIKLTGDRLLEAGWPNVNWEALLISYEGRWFKHTADYYLDGPSPGTAIRSDQLDEIELIQFEYEPQPELSAGLESLFAPATVTDYLRVYRPAGAMTNDVIVIDRCPKESIQAEYVVYRKIDVEG